MNLRKDKKFHQRFWCGRGKFDWVDLPYPINWIKEDIVSTTAMLYRIIPNAETGVIVKQILG